MQCIGSSMAAVGVNSSISNARWKKMPPQSNTQNIYSSPSLLMLLLLQLHLVVVEAQGFSLITFFWSNHITFFKHFFYTFFLKKVLKKIGVLDDVPLATLRHGRVAKTSFLQFWQKWPKTRGRALKRPRLTERSNPADGEDRRSTPSVRVGRGPSEVTGRGYGPEVEVNSDEVKLTEGRYDFPYNGRLPGCVQQSIHLSLYSRAPRVPQAKYSHVF